MVLVCCYFCFRESTYWEILGSVLYGVVCCYFCSYDFLFLICTRMLRLPHLKLYCHHTINHQQDAHETVSWMLLLCLQLACSTKTSIYGLQCVNFVLVSEVHTFYVLEHNNNFILQLLQTNTRLAVFRELCNIMNFLLTKAWCFFLSLGVNFAIWISGSKL